MFPPLNIVCIKIHMAIPCVFFSLPYSFLRLKFHPLFPVDPQDSPDGAAEQKGGQLPQRGGAQGLAGEEGGGPQADSEQGPAAQAVPEAPLPAEEGGG